MAEYTVQKDSDTAYSVWKGDTRISNHSTPHDASAAIKRYEAADKRQKERDQ